MLEQVKFVDLTMSELRIGRNVVAVDPNNPRFRETVRIMAAPVPRADRRVTPYPPDLSVEIDSTDHAQLHELLERIELIDNESAV